jgi:hypothetical protein
MPVYGLLGIEIYIPSLDEIVNAVISPIANLVTSGLSGLVSTLSPLFANVVTALSPLFQGVIDAITNFVRDPLGYLQGTLGSVWGAVSGLFDQITQALGGLWTSISAAVGSLAGQITSGLEGLGGLVSSGLSTVSSSILSVLNDARTALESGLVTLGSSLSGALEATGGVMLTAFDGMGNALAGILGGVFSGFGSLSLPDVMGAVTGISAQLETAIVSLAAFHSPITPQEAAAFVPGFTTQVQAAATSLHIANIVAEAASLGQVDVTLTDAWRYPNTEAALAVASELVAMPLKEGLMPAFKRYILANYVPLIPDFQSLISIYVKEGYLESHWVEMPAEMAQNFRELGYSQEWALKLWGQHWVYPSPTQLYEMLHRTAGNFPEIGVTDAILRDMLKLHDFEPKWRGPLEAISWNTWRIYDIRTGWEMDLVNDLGLVKRLVDTGYEPKDAELLASVQKMFVLRSEIDGLLTESDTDFMSGWISEDQLKADYWATPYNASIIEMRIAKAKLRQERTDKADLKAALINRFVKGDLNETEFAQELSRLGVQQNRIAIELTKADATKLKTVKEETTLTSKALTEATYSRAFRVGVISEEEYVARLEALKYSQDDIDILVELNTPERPSPEVLPTLTLGELKAAFRVEILTEDEFAAELASRGYSYEDMAIIIETERLKIKPKTAAEGVAG